MSEVENIEVLVKKLEELRKSKVITLIFSTTSLITDSTVSELYDNLEKMFKDGPVENLDVIINSYGGDIDAAYQLATLLRRYATKKLTFIVPRFAKSAATLTVCGGHEILMGPLSELGPLDPQIHDILRMEEFSPLSIPFIETHIDKLIKEGKEEVARLLMEKIPALSLGEHIRSLEVGKNYLTKLLTTGMFKDDPNNPNITEGISKRLVEDYPHHGYCIDLEEARNIGLKIGEITKEEWEIIWKIYKLFLKESEKKAKEQVLPKDISKVIEKISKISG